MKLIKLLRETFDLGEEEVWVNPQLIETMRRREKQVTARYTRITMQSGSIEDVKETPLEIVELIINDTNLFRAYP